MAGPRFDLTVVGRGIVGLAHALAGARARLRVAVIDRETRAVGASVRNFGFVTVTGQQAGITWRRARRARDVWAELVPEAGIPVLQRGLLVCARRPESAAVLAEFAAGEMGRGCELLGRDALPPGFNDGVLGALRSPHELRVESRDAVPRLAAHLAERHGVTFLPRAAVLGIEGGRVHTARGEVAAEHVVACPGTDLTTLFPERIAARGVTPVQAAHAARGRPRDEAARAGDGRPRPRALRRLRGDAVAARPARPAGSGAGGLARRRHPPDRGAGRRRLAGGGRQPPLRRQPGPVPAAGGRRPHPGRAVRRARPATPGGAGALGRRLPVRPEPAFSETVAPGVRLAMVTSGTGASTAFALAEETLADLLGLPAPEHTREFA